MWVPEIDTFGDMGAKGARSGWLFVAFGYF